MTWNVIRWVWRLEAPLYLGLPPAGSLNRCRLYVPARAVHGALAAEFARAKRVECDSTALPHYSNLGHELGHQCRFTYLYPAEKTDTTYEPWLPQFENGQGLCWCGPGNLVSDSLFRRRLLDTRPGVSIAPQSDSAADGQLWETECLSQWWRNPDGEQNRQGPVFLVGYVFTKGDAFQGRLSNCNVLFLGGDTRYGLGKIRQVEYKKVNVAAEKCYHVFDARVTRSADEPILRTKRILGHEKVGPQAPNDQRQGVQEIAGGWNIREVFQDGLCWAPGSQTEEEALWSIDRFGYWERHNA